MKLVIRKSATVWSAAVAVALLLIGGIFAITTMSRAQALEGEGRIITVYDRGTVSTFLSTETTVETALGDAEIIIEPHDVVEPALNEELVGDEYNINIYRSRTVLVVDGPVKSKIVTAHQTPRLIAQAAGVTLYTEDSVSLERSTNVLATGGSLQAIVDRATSFTFDMYGETTTARTQAETVGGLLQEKGIELASNDRVQPSEDTSITEGMSVRVWREGRQTITQSEPVDFETQEIRDGDRPVGYREVRTSGVAGAQNVTYEVVIQDGQEVSREKIASIVTKQPTKEVVVVGIKPVIMPYTGGGTKTEWLAASNIPEESWGYADFMVQKESSWNPNAVNVSSGACGLAQALPCSKIPGQWNDPVNALNWMNNYVNGRYGGWAGAHSFWLENRWY